MFFYTESVKYIELEIRIRTAISERERNNSKTTTLRSYTEQSARVRYKSTSQNKRRNLKR